MNSKKKIREFVLLEKSTPRKIKTKTKNNNKKKKKKKKTKTKKKQQIFKMTEKSLNQ